MEKIKIKWSGDYEISEKRKRIFIKYGAALIAVQIEIYDDRSMKDMEIRQGEMIIMVRYGYAVGHRHNIRRIFEVEANNDVIDLFTFVYLNWKQILKEVVKKEFADCDQVFIKVQDIKEGELELRGRKKSSDDIEEDFHFSRMLDWLWEGVENES